MTSTRAGAPNADQAGMDAVTAYLNAGGRGTRLSGLVPAGPRGIAKALIAVGDPPRTILSHQVGWLESAGVRSVVVGAGDHGDVADTARELSRGRSITVDATVFGDERGTGGDFLRSLATQPDLFSDLIVVANVDTLVDLDLGALVSHHLRASNEVTIALTRDPTAANAGAFEVSSTGLVRVNHEARPPAASQIAGDVTTYTASSTGVLVVSRDAVERVAWSASTAKFGIYGPMIGRWIRDGFRVGAFDNGDRLFLDIGTPPGWARLLAGSPDIARELERV